MERPFSNASSAHRRRWIVGLVLVVSAVLAVGLLQREELREFVEDELFRARLERYAPHFVAAGAESGVDPYVLAAMACVESSVRPSAESKAGALGLLQLQVPTAADMARRLRVPPPTREELLDDPELNVRLGAAYLAWLLPRQEGDWERALMAYNTGPTRFQRWLRDAGGYEAWRAKMDAEGPPGPGSVRHYAAKVLRLATELRRDDVLGTSASSADSREGSSR
ncbi:MAG: transglycosylase SLT domain-containing protein [Planctomycetaceae bacterium]|nr:transglycosylase SLT domain-containing protein [Planctomycetaceae bacterium]